MKNVFKYLNRNSKLSKNSYGFFKQRNFSNENKPKITFNDLEIRTVTTNEEYKNTLFRFAVEAGWVPAPSDADVTPMEGQKHHYAAYYKNDLVFVFMLHCFPEQKISYFNNYITSPKYQGLGLTKDFFVERFYHVYKNEGYQMAWTGVPLMWKKYEKVLDGKTYGISYKYVANKNSEVDPKHVSTNVKSNDYILKMKNGIQQVKDYQRSVLTLNLDSFTDKALVHKNIKTYAYVEKQGDKEVVRGVAFVRDVNSDPASYSVNIGPLNADNDDIFKDMLMTIVNDLPLKTKMYIGINLYDDLGVRNNFLRQRILFDNIDIEQKPRDLYNYSMIQSTAPLPYDFKRNYVFTNFEFYI